jgi:hypothetical protein
VSKGKLLGLTAAQPVDRMLRSSHDLQSEFHGANPDQSTVLPSRKSYSKASSSGMSKVPSVEHFKLGPGSFQKQTAAEHCSSMRLAICR